MLVLNLHPRDTNHFIDHHLVMLLEAEWEKKGHIKKKDWMKKGQKNASWKVAVLCNVMAPTRTVSPYASF
jgi:hypothetical protein